MTVLTDDGSVIAPDMPNFSEGFLQDEDNALRNHLRGITVSDNQVPDRPVGVWFSHPDTEMREQKYPYMVITLIDVTEAKNRVMSGRSEVTGISVASLENVGIYPEIYDGQVYNAAGLWNDIWMDTSSFPLKFYGHAPLPVQIDYQIRAFSRHPRHARSIVASFLGNKVPYRYGFLDMSYIDGSVRRLELLDISHGEQVENSKRLFITAFTVRVDSWMPYGDDVEVIENALVTKVYGVLNVTDPEGQPYPNPDNRFGWYLEADAEGYWSQSNA